MCSSEKGVAGALQYATSNYVHSASCPQMHAADELEGLRQRVAALEGQLVANAEQAGARIAALEKEIAELRAGGTPEHGGIRRNPAGGDGDGAAADAPAAAENLKLVFQSAPAAVVGRRNSHVDTATGKPDPRTAHRGCPITEPGHRKLGVNIWITDWDLQGLAL